MKYTFIRTNNKYIVISRYAGKPVKGVAKCSPEDEFNEFKGQKLALARCDAKVASKRLKNAKKKYKEAELALFQAKKRFDNMCSYLTDANRKEAEAYQKLEELEKTL